MVLVKRVRLSVSGRGQLSSWNSNLPLAIRDLPNLDGSAVTRMYCVELRICSLSLSLTPRPHLDVSAPMRRRHLRRVLVCGRDAVSAVSTSLAQPPTGIRGSRAHGAAVPVTLPVSCAVSSLHVSERPPPWPGGVRRWLLIAS